MTGHGDHFDRNSWDLVNTLMAVRGVNTSYFNQTTYQYYNVDVSGSPETFVDSYSEGIYNQLEYYSDVANKTETITLIEKELNVLLCQEPKKNEQNL